MIEENSNIDNNKLPLWPELSPTLSAVLTSSSSLAAFFSCSALRASSRFNSYSFSRWSSRARALMRWYCLVSLTPSI